MHDVFLAQIFQPLVELGRNGKQLSFGEVSFFLEHPLETAALAQFGDEVAVVGALQDLHAAQHMRVVQLPDDGYLLLMQFFQLLEGERVELDHLYCYFLV